MRDRERLSSTILAPDLTQVFLRSSCPKKMCALPLLFCSNNFRAKISNRVDYKKMYFKLFFESMSQKGDFLLQILDEFIFRVQLFIDHRSVVNELGVVSIFECAEGLFVVGIRRGQASNH